MVAGTQKIIQMATGHLIHAKTRSICVRIKSIVKSRRMKASIKEELLFFLEYSKKNKEKKTLKTFMENNYFPIEPKRKKPPDFFRAVV